MTEPDIRALVEELFAALDTGGDQELTDALERLEAWRTKQPLPELEEVA